MSLPSPHSRTRAHTSFVPQDIAELEAQLQDVEMKIAAEKERLGICMVRAQTPHSISVAPCKYTTLCCCSCKKTTLYLCCSLQVHHTLLLLLQEHHSLLLLLRSCTGLLPLRLLHPLRTQWMKRKLRAVASGSNSSSCAYPHKAFGLCRDDVSYTSLPTRVFLRHVPANRTPAAIQRCTSLPGPF